MAGYQSSLETTDFSNLDASVFSSCPEALNADDYSASQVSTIAQQALNVSRLANSTLCALLRLLEVTIFCTTTLANRFKPISVIFGK